ncbi:MAG: DUF3108 domain-containing protein [Bacteroidota bacterium]|nr:DUF3108 domain-containing protein [Odoribacter sp.]MDP3642438.1 DUF3108 domain-containing protein [Bacteroidota bacterium]
MKIHIYFLFILMFLALPVCAQETFTPPVKPNTAFIAGEHLTYQIRYGLIVAGITTLSLTEEVYQEKTVFHALTIGQTTGLADKLYGVKDIYESWFDKNTNLPFKQIRNISEGRYKKYNEVTYNRENNTVNSKLSGIHSVPADILDLASSFYYIRRIDFSKVTEGDVLLVNMFFSDGIFPFHLVFKGKETIRTKFGKIRCIKICPVVEVGRMFKTQNDLTIWFTDDDNCLPVLVKMDIRIVGSVLLKLIHYENIANTLIFQK